MQSKNIAKFIIAIAVTLYALFNIQLSESKNIKYDSNIQSIDSKEVNIINMHGDYLHALMAAYDDFEKSLKDKYSGSATPVSVHLSNIFNYSIQLQKLDAEHVYRVHFSPEALQGGSFKGGGVTYLIDANTFKIKNIERSM